MYSVATTTSSCRPFWFSNLSCQARWQKEPTLLELKGAWGTVQKECGFLKQQEISIKALAKIHSFTYLFAQQTLKIIGWYQRWEAVDINAAGANPTLPPSRSLFCSGVRFWKCIQIIHEDCWAHRQLRSTWDSLHWSLRNRAHKTMQLLQLLY